MVLKWGIRYCFRPKNSLDITGTTIDSIGGTHSLNSITQINHNQSQILAKDQQFVWHPYSSLTDPIPAYEVTSAEVSTYDWQMAPS